MIGKDFDQCVDFIFVGCVEKLWCIGCTLNLEWGWKLSNSYYEDQEEFENVLLSVKTNSITIQYLISKSDQDQEAFINANLPCVDELKQMLEGAGVNIRDLHLT